VDHLQVKMGMGGKPVQGTQTDAVPSLLQQSIQIVQRAATHAVALPYARNDAPQIVMSMPLSESESDYESEPGP